LLQDDLIVHLFHPLFLSHSPRNHDRATFEKILESTNIQACPAYSRAKNRDFAHSGVSQISYIGIVIYAWLEFDLEKFEKNSRKKVEIWPRKYA
jgi:hypothetical protein